MHLHILFYVKVLMDRESNTNQETQITIEENEKTNIEVESKITPESTNWVFLHSLIILSDSQYS